MFGTIATLASDQAPGQSAPLIAIQFHQRWLGVNSTGVLLEVRTNDGGVVTSASELTPSTELLQKLRLQISQVEDPKLLEKNRSATAHAPAETPGIRVSRMLVASAPSGKAWEYHFFKPEDLPPPLQEAMTLLESNAKLGCPLQAGGLVICDDLTRSFTPDGLSYAEMYRRNGMPFMSVSSDSFPLSQSVLAACALHCGTLEKITKEQTAEINRVPIRNQGATLLSVADKDVGCVVFPIQTTGDAPLPLPRHERRKIVDEQDLPVDSPSINPPQSAK